MNENTENTDWLNDYPALKNQSRENPFRVPENFFEEQQERIHAAIYADELSKKLPSAGFIIPDGYFKNMEEQILSVVKLEEIRPTETYIKSDQFFEEQQSIIAARIKINEYAENGSGFTVPDNYFNDLTNRIIQKTGIKEVQQPAKVRSLFTRAAWKYATAACIAVAVATGFFIKQYQSAHNVQMQLSNLPDADIENYLQIHADTYDNHVILENSTLDTDVDIQNNQTSTDSNETNIH
ncbi:hypothetical protein [Mucilaginibacter arboris]|uniref:Uncharacterized protein n=1 Tax=Mucilaginibacter arboris TaxID=2682090 RepID=A0A7K1SV84_9SPHI|nr:hypothetical protein [Mucilaginibacter arboris]MVN20950.1 hypothetical protein [Mucilaginibacter arboris]